MLVEDGLRPQPAAGGSAPPVSSGDAGTEEQTSRGVRSSLDSSSVFILLLIPTPLPLLALGARRFLCRQETSRWRRTSHPSQSGQSKGRFTHLHHYPHPLRIKKEKRIRSCAPTTTNNTWLRPPRGPASRGSSSPRGRHLHPCAHHPHRCSRREAPPPPRCRLETASHVTTSDSVNRGTGSGGGGREGGGVGLTVLVVVGV